MQNAYILPHCVEPKRCLWVWAAMLDMVCAGRKAGVDVMRVY